MLERRPSETGEEEAPKGKTYCGLCDHSSAYYLDTGGAYRKPLGGGAVARNHARHNALHGGIRPAAEVGHNSRHFRALAALVLGDLLRYPLDPEMVQERRAEWRLHWLSLGCPPY